MPKGHYHPAVRRYSHQEFVLYLLREGPRYASALVDALRNRIPQRQAAYALLRSMERDGHLSSVITDTGGLHYTYATRAQCEQWRASQHAVHAQEGEEGHEVAQYGHDETRAQLTLDHGQVSTEGGKRVHVSGTQRPR